MEGYTFVIKDLYFVMERTSSWGTVRRVRVRLTDATIAIEGIAALNDYFGVERMKRFVTRTPLRTDQCLAIVVLLKKTGWLQEPVRGLYSWVDALGPTAIVEDLIHSVQKRRRYGQKIGSGHARKANEDG